MEFSLRTQRGRLGPAHLTYHCADLRRPGRDLFTRYRSPQYVYQACCSREPIGSVFRASFIVSLGRPRAGSIGRRIALARPGGLLPGIAFHIFGRPAQELDVVHEVGGPFRQTEPLSFPDVVDIPHRLAQERLPRHKDGEVLHGCSICKPPRQPSRAAIPSRFPAQARIFPFPCAFRSSGRVARQSVLSALDRSMPS